MTRSTLRARVAIGSSIVVAAISTVAVASSASASTPPSEPPTSGAAEPTAGGDHDALVETILSTSAEAAVPMNRDCVTGIVEQIPPEDVATILGQIESSAAVADITMPDMSMPDIQMPDLSMPDLGDISIPDLGEITIPELGDIEIPDISIPDLGDISIPDLGDISIPDLSMPAMPEIALSEETLELSRELVTCVEGDADPALVEQVVALAESSAPEGLLDLDCTAKMLSTFPDEVLQQLIDSGAVEADPTSVDPAIAAEVAKLLACTDLSMAGSTAAAVEVEAVPVTTA